MNQEGEAVEGEWEGGRGETGGFSFNSPILILILYMKSSSSEGEGEYRNGPVPFLSTKRAGTSRFFDRGAFGAGASHGTTAVTSVPAHVLPLTRQALESIGMATLKVG